MTLDDIGLYSELINAPEPHKPLHAQARCVCALVRRYLPRLKNDQAWKINVYVRSGNTDQLVTTHDGITSVELSRNVEEFFHLGDTDKKLFAYEALREGATVISEHHKWPIGAIHQAFDKAMEVDLVNEWRFQPKWSPSRKHRAYVQCSHEIERFRAWLRIEDRDGQLVKEQHLFDEYPDEFCFFQQLGSVRWIDRTTARLTNRSGEIVGKELILD